MSRFVSVRSRRLSLWQSAVQEATGRLTRLDPATRKLMRQAASRHAELASKGKQIPRPAHTAGAPLTLADHVVLSRAHLDLADGQRTGNQAQAEAALAVIRDYSEYDPNWATCVTQYNLYYVDAGDQPVYVNWAAQNPPVPISTFAVLGYQLPNDAKVLMLGDWGTGMTNAVSMLVQALTQLKPDAIIHLGDVYYRGSNRSVPPTSLRLCRRPFKQRTCNRSPSSRFPAITNTIPGARGFTPCWAS